MYLWVPRGRTSVCQITHKCFCQISSVNKQNTIDVRYNKSIFLKSYSIYSKAIFRVPITQTSGLQSKYKRLTAMSERDFGSSREDRDDSEAPKLSNKAKLKRAVKDYGATVIVFHVTISLMSLGISYLVISSGVDVVSLLNKVGLDSKSEIAAGASTFVVAYALHKVFAPVRISITLGSTPFIVRYLRRVGILKPPKPPVT